MKCAVRREETQCGGLETQCGGGDAVRGVEKQCGGGDTVWGGGDAVRGVGDAVRGGGDAVRGEETRCGGEETQCGGGDAVRGVGDAVRGEETQCRGLSVRGPAMPLRVQLGASVTLPCTVDTPIPLHELEVQWMREDSGSLVHLSLGGESRPESQSPAYSGRAEFFTEEISKGNFSLLLMNVTTEDKGMYKCVVHTEHESSETNVTIDTERLVVTGADVPVFAYAGEDVILNCSVDTHVPLRELEVEWMKTNEEIQVLLFMEGRYRPESQPERFRGRAEFFSEEIPKGNFSMKLRDVKPEDGGEFMCRVHTCAESISLYTYSANATTLLEISRFSTLQWILLITLPIIGLIIIMCIAKLCCKGKCSLLFHSI
ncbi:butyrophilin subfamily 2 member A2-like [Conger conger]|uniref:butyrophilin subfamily 2 member A2-like n=1 Tax=Conger conger TaxID=82655 RepID=UPI002A59AD82|nr:butyrophilin subfamily 2 member A2-like [Conger conger]